MDAIKKTSLLPPDQQAIQRAKVAEKVLSFLLIETFTSTEVLQEYLGYSSRLGCHKSLRRLKKVGYITEYDLDTLSGRKIKLWGITSKGIYAISDPEIAVPKVKTFNTSKISLLTLPHRLKSHEICIQAIKDGYKFENASILFNPKTNEFISLEIELSVKTVSRYEKIKKRLEKIFNLFTSPGLGLHKVVTIDEHHLPALR